MTTHPYELDLLTAASVAHRLEANELQGRIERLVALLREHGIALPEEDPRLGASDGEHLEACRTVVVKAYELLEALDALRAMVGSGMELIGGDEWRA